MHNTVLALTVIVYHALRLPGTVRPLLTVIKKTKKVVDLSNKTLSTH